MGIHNWQLLSGYLINSDSENWAEFGPFGIDENNRLTRFGAFKSAKAYHNFILSILFSPTIALKRIGGSDNFIITINIPLYNDANSEVYLKTSITEHERVYNNIRPIRYSVPINKPFLDKKITHFIAEPTEIRDSKGKVCQIEYQAVFNMNPTAHREVVRIKVETQVVTDNINYPQKLDGYENVSYEAGDTCYKADTPIEQVVNQGAWASDVY